MKRESRNAPESGPFSSPLGGPLEIPAKGYNPVRKGGLRASIGTSAAETDWKSLPAVPEGYFLYQMYVSA
jgi:hypothetical protein